MDKLRALVERLSSPVVGPRLTRQELCLSFAAVHKLYAPTSFVARPPSEKAQWRPLHSSILASRVKRISLSCSRQEVAMLAEGWSVSHWRRWDVVDNLVAAIFRLTQQGEMKNTTITVTQLSECTAMLEAACSSQHYFNASLTAFGERSLQLCATAQETSKTTLKRFLWAMTCYVGGRRMATMVEELMRPNNGVNTDVVSEFKSILTNIQEQKDMSLQKNILDRQQCLQSLEEEDSGLLLTSPERARSLLYRWWETSRMQGTVVPAEVLREHTALFLHHGFHDPVLQSSLEESILVLLKKKEDVTGVVETIYKRPESFPRIREFLASHKVIEGEGEKALQTQQAVFDAFKKILQGRSVDEEVLARIREELEGAQSDARAMSAAVLMASNKLPDGFAPSLAAEVSTLSLIGITAILFLLQFDTSGSFAVLAESALTRALNSKLKGGSVEEVLLLSRALAQPLSRYFSPSKSFLETHQSLKEAVLQHWMELLHEESVPLPRMMDITTTVSILDDEKALAFAVGDRILSVMRNRKTDLSLDDCLDALHMLVSSNCIHEELLDFIAGPLSCFVANSIEGIISTEDMQEHVLRFALDQSTLDAPGLSSVASMITGAVSLKRDIATPFLIAAGLLENKEGHDVNVFNILGRLAEKDEKLIDVQSIPYLIHLLYETRSISPPIKILQRVEAVLESNFSLPEPLLGAADVGRFLVAKGNATIKEKFPLPLLQVCAGAVFSFPPQLYTCLIEVVWRFADCEPLTTSLVESFPRMLNRLTPENISDAVFGLGQVPHAGLLLSHQLTADVASDYVVDNNELFNSGKTISRMLHGFSRLHITKRTLYSVFSEKLSKRAVLPTLDRSSISLAMSALGTAKFLHQGLFTKFATLFIQQSKGLTCADLLLSIKAMSRVMLMNHNFYETLGDEAASKINQLSLGAQCDLLHAYGAVDLPHHQLAESICENVATHLDEIPDANAACAVLLSLRRMNYNVREDPNTVALADYITERVDQLSTQSTAVLCAVLEDADWKHMPLLTAIAEHSINLKKNELLTPECSRGVLDLLARNLVHHSLARNELTSLARVVSKENVSLSEDEALEHQLLVAR